jgi:hypothetical protein
MWDMLSAWGEGGNLRGERAGIRTHEPCVALTFRSAGWESEKMPTYLVVLTFRSAEWESEKMPTYLVALTFRSAGPESQKMPT